MSKITTYLVFLLAITCIQAYSQSAADSLVLAQTKWQMVDLGNGLSWKKIHFQQKELFNANQSINILQSSWKNKQTKLAFFTADSMGKKRLLPTSKIALQNEALAAINGTFFDTKNGGSVDLIKIDGQLLDTTRSPNGKRAEHQQAAIIIKRNKLWIVKGGDSPDWDKNLKAKNVMVTGPLLILNYEVQVLKKAPFNDNRHPRTCACVTQDKKLLLITIDGRTPQAQGMSLHELTFLSKQLGCKDAINLDGGGSTTLYIANQPDNGVVNYPCDNKLFDHQGERAVSNGLMFLKR